MTLRDACIWGVSFGSLLTSLVAVVLLFFAARSLQQERDRAVAQLVDVLDKAERVESSCRYCYEHVGVDLALQAEFISAQVMEFTQRLNRWNEEVPTVCPK